MKSDILKKKSVRIAAAVLAVLLVLGFAFFMYTQIRAQRAKLDEIREEKERLLERLYELQREQERLESNLEYVKSNEGRLRYARENLGYLGEDEIRVNVNE